MLGDHSFGRLTTSWRVNVALARAGIASAPKSIGDSAEAAAQLHDWVACERLRTLALAVIAAAQRGQGSRDCTCTFSMSTRSTARSETSRSRPP